MKFCLIFILSFITIFQSLDRLGWVGYYFFNRAYIAAELCENKAKPQLQCNGKCFLSKKLQKEEKKEAPKLDVKRELQFFVQTPLLVQVHNPFKINLLVYAFRSKFYLQEFVDQGVILSVFRPPNF